MSFFWFSFAVAALIIGKREEIRNTELRRRVVTLTKYNRKLEQRLAKERTWRVHG